jgi:hypothetical protein
VTVVWVANPAPPQAVVPVFQTVSVIVAGCPCTSGFGDIVLFIARSHGLVVVVVGLGYGSWAMLVGGFTMRFA